ncbi:MAG: serine hydrolase domain-containing protein [Flavobacteriales bacterium]
MTGLLKQIQFFSILALFVVEACTSSEPSPLPVASLQDAVPVEPKPFATDSEEKLTHYFDSLMDHKWFSGVVLFAKDNAILKFSRGDREHGDQSPIELDDQFQLASVSKPFTAFATIMLADRGRIALDDPVAKYIDPFPYPNVTIEHLLTHTSGIGYYAYVTDSLWGYPELFMNNSDFETMMQCHEVPEYFRPDEAFDYCNTNYALLANIIEKVSGVSFHDFMRDSLFTPAGMFDSEIMNVFERNPLDYPVQGHYPSGSQKLPFYLDGVVGDKGMYSNVMDLYKFYLETRNGKLISDSLWSKASAPQRRYAHDQYYGYGWRIRPLEDGDTLVYHNGWWRGFRTYFWTSKHHDKCAIMLTNTTRGPYLSQEEIWWLF